jgi:streptogrisin C
VALTEAEVQELERRERITQGLEPLTRALDAFPDFAGLYFDQRAGGVVDIAIAGDASLPSSVLSLAPSGANVRLRSVQHALRELQSLHEDVADDINNWSAKGISINAVGVDVPSNSVRIEVANLTDAARQDLVDTYGTRISIAEGEGYTFAACVSRNNCAAPLKGGLVITAANGPICTSGFVGRPTDPPITPVLRLLTAGHCIDVGAGGSGLGVNWSHNGVVIGDARFERLYNNTSADVGGIFMTESGARNKVYASDSLDIRSVTGKWTSAQQPQGATVCRGGRTSGWFCAQISLPDQTVTVQGITL